MFKAIFKVAAWVLFCLLALSCSKDVKGSDVLAYLSADDAFVEAFDHLSRADGEFQRRAVDRNPGSG